MRLILTKSFSSRSAGIDLLRILSVAVVIFSHYAVYPPLDFGGTRGVVIFFMVSGFCMAYSIQGRTGTQYLMARILRLVPTFLICASITTIVEQTWPGLRPDRLHSWLDYFKNLVCLPFGNVMCDGYYQFVRGQPVDYQWVDGAYWSLLVELRFYLLLWLIFFVLRLKSVGLVIAGISFLAAAKLNVPLISKGDDFLPYLSFFSFGLAVRSINDGDRWGLLTAALALGSFAICSIVGVSSPSLPLNTANFLGYFACFAIFVVVLRLAGDWHSQLIGRIGVLTYPIYLLHQDVGFVIIAGFAPLTGAIWAKLFAVTAVVSLAVGVEHIVSRLQGNMKRYQRRAPAQ
jgi:peptidoglycan/LPS O-acetylase OafA/YrhL